MKKSAYNKKIVPMQRLSPTEGMGIKIKAIKLFGIKWRDGIAGLSRDLFEDTGICWRVELKWILQRSVSEKKRLKRKHIQVLIG